MEINEMEENHQLEHQHVDASRPFRSVKEAVAIFGQRIMLPVQTHSLTPKPVSPIASRGICQITKLVSPTASPSSRFTKPVSPIASLSISETVSSWNQCSLLPSSPQGPTEEVMDVLENLEAEIRETKTEVKMLKKRESETDVALATLNAELQKNKSKIVKAEADAAGKRAAAMAKSVSFKEIKEMENGEEVRRKELTRRIQKEYPSLTQIQRWVFCKDYKKTYHSSRGRFLLLQEERIFE